MIQIKEKKLTTISRLLASSFLVFLCGYDMDSDLLGFDSDFLSLDSDFSGVDSD
jgi:hypothetical protein